MVQKTAWAAIKQIQVTRFQVLIKGNLNFPQKIFENSGELNLTEGATNTKYSLTTYYINSSPLQISNLTKEESLLLWGKLNITYFELYYSFTSQYQA